MIKDTIGQTLFVGDIVIYYSYFYKITAITTRGVIKGICLNSFGDTQTHKKISPDKCLKLNEDQRIMVYETYANYISMKRIQ